MKEAEFAQFLSRDFDETINLFESRGGYFDAVARGLVWSATRAALDRIRPEVVAVAGWSFPESMSAIAWAHQNDARVVMMSESQSHDSNRHLVREAVKRRIVSACDAALVGGRVHADYVTHLGLKSESVFLGYDVVDNRHFSEGAARARSNATALRQVHGLPPRFLLASARFIAKKNLVSLVHAFGMALKRAQTPHSLVILGDGPGRPALEAAIVDAGLFGRVMLPGFICYDDLPIYYGLAEAFVHVSLVEQWGLVVNEAAAAGLPLIVSKRCGSASELVRPGFNGRLVEPGDTEDILDALHRTMILSEDERIRFGAESSRIVSGWGLDRFASGLQAAIGAAYRYPGRRLAFQDRLLLRALGRHYFAEVS